MDRIATIIGFEWRAYWRRFSRAGLRSNQGIVFVLAALIGLKYFQVLLSAKVQVANGNLKLLATLLAAIFLAWLFPLASAKRDTLASRKWLHLPLSLKERFIIRTISILIPPTAWLVLAGSLAILYPLANGENPLAGMLAGLLFIALAWLTGRTIAHLLNSTYFRILFWVVGLTLLTFGAFYVIKGKPAADFLAYRFSPTKLVTDAAMTSSKGSLVLLGALLAAAFGAALWSFKKSLVSGFETTGQKSFISSPNLPGRLGGLVAKDFRYFRRLLDIYLGLAAATLGCVYLVVAETASAGVFWSFIVVVFLCNAALAFNGFGLDNRAGLERYALLPLNGRAILLSKNLAYRVILGAQLFPMLVLGSWRFGILTSAFGLLEAVALACAYLAWGNWMSVSNPLKMQFFRFANSGAALADEMGGMIFGSLPGIVMIYLLVKGGPRSAGGIALLLLLTGALYFVSLRRFGNRFEQRRERIAEALS